MRFLFLVLTLFPVAAFAQTADPDPLTATLPSGRVVHFETAEQKAKFVAAQQRQQQAVAATTPTPKPSAAASAGMGHTALDAKPSGTGVGNTGAPMFTADYYLPAAETWVGKPITLAVAYVSLHNEAARSDGMKQLDAYTWGRMPSTGEPNGGGVITILASPAAALNLAKQCGTTLHFGSGGVQTTHIHGEMNILKTVGTNDKEYGLIIGD